MCVCVLCVCVLLCQGVAVSGCCPLVFVHREAELTHKLELGREEYTKKATEANNLSRQLKKVQVCVCACVPHIRTGGASRSEVHRSQHRASTQCAHRAQSADGHQCMFTSVLFPLPLRLPLPSSFL